MKLKQNGLKKAAAGLLFLLLTGQLAIAFGAQIQGITVPDDAQTLDFGTKRVRHLEELEAFLESMPQLKKVDMFATPITGKQADALTKRFPEIEFGWTLRIPCKDHDHYIRTDATAFSTLHNKRSQRHSSDDFRILRYCRNLLALDIGHNKVTDLDFLYDLPDLRVLIIAINEVTDITPLASLHDLQYAEIFKNQIADLSPISGLRNLVDLNIAFNSVSDWTPLYSLKGLERLWIYSSSMYGSGRSFMTPQVVDGLKANLPDTYIDWEHYSTAGGWREHPRYEVLAEMFKKGEYIPFEQ
ncbi:MAG: leucine-rich repeat domain-containing protein [Clostridia bacterium]|nr:leucine-rich repeat domain-containing protein [Clostridia bacterium]